MPTGVKVFTALIIILSIAGASYIVSSILNTRSEGQAAVTNYIQDVLSGSNVEVNQLRYDTYPAFYTDNKGIRYFGIFGYEDGVVIPEGAK